MAVFIKQAKTDQFRLGSSLQFFADAELTTEIPLKNGRIVYQLSKEEKELVENFYGLELDNPAHTMEWLERVTLNTKPTIDVVNADDAESVLKKGILLANNTYAPSLEASQDVMKGYKFVLYDQGQEELQKYTLNEVFHKAIGELIKLRKKSRKLLAVAKYVLPATVGIQDNEERAYNSLTDFLDGKFEGKSRRKSIDEFLGALYMDETRLFVTIDFKEALRKNIIRTDADGYYMNPLSGNRYGKTRDEVIDYLCNPINQEELGLNNKDDKSYSIRYQLKNK